MRLFGIMAILPTVESLEFDFPMPLPHFKNAVNAPHYDARFFKGRMSSGDRHQVLAVLLRDFDRWCGLLGIQPILMHGALLGHYLCDGQLLPWEDNIDLVLPFDDLRKMAESEPLYDASSQLFDLNPHHVSRSTLNLHPMQNREPNRIDAKFIDRATGLHIAVTAAIRDGDFLTTKCPHRWKFADIYPLDPSYLMGSPANLPKESVGILRGEYGDLDRIKTEINILTFLRGFADTAPPAMPMMSGRGIVTTASDKYLQFLRVLLKSLSEHGCAMPVEVWHRSGEIGQDAIAELTTTQVKFLSFAVDDEQRHGFACKPAAILASSFAEILFLDADNSVLSNPEFLFDSPAYIATGALMWPDQAYALRREPEFRRILELPPQFTPVESGQFLVDKRRHWHGLHIIDQLNRASVVTYRFAYGDKDTYCMGFEMAEESFTLHPLRPQRLADCSFLHSAADGKPLFRHRSAGDSKFF